MGFKGVTQDLMKGKSPKKNFQKCPPKQVLMQPKALGDDGLNTYSGESRVLKVENWSTRGYKS